MSYLSQLVEHPISLLIATALSCPFIWQLFKLWFPNLKQDLKEDAPYTLLALVGGQFINWLYAKLLWFGIFISAILVTFYKLTVWITNW